MKESAEYKLFEFVSKDICLLCSCGWRVVVKENMFPDTQESANRIVNSHIKYWCPLRQNENETS